MDYKNIFGDYRKLVFGGVSLLTVLLVIGCAASHGGDEDQSTEEVFVPEVGTVIVAPGLSHEIATTGEVQAAKSATLTPEARADVRNVFVKVGDEVRAGQLLIQLSSSSISSSTSTSSAAYVNAKNSLTQTQLSSEKSIDSARIALDTAEISLEQTLAKNTALLAQAQETLNSALLSSDLSVSSAQTTLNNAISSAYPTAQNAISESDEIIGVSSTYKNSNDSYEHFLGALNYSSMLNAENAITVALNALRSSASDYDSALTLLNFAEEAASDTLDVLNSSTTGTDFTQTTLNAHISNINAQISSVRSAISTLNSAKSALESAEQSTNGGSQAALSAQANYDATVAQLEANEKSARQSVESAKAALESAQKSAELSEISAKASLDSAAGNLNQARISESKLQIRAPFSGKITAVEVEPGDEVAAGAALVTIEDDGQLKIVTHLSSEEVRKVAIGDEIKIAKKSSDTIAAISPSADPVTKKYEVEIYHQNPYLQPGQFVKLRFQVGDRDTTDSRVFLPINAINILSYGSFVWKIEDGKAIKTEVQLGDIEGEYVEILGGLELGDEVIVAGGRILDTSRDNLDVKILGE